MIQSSEMISNPRQVLSWLIVLALGLLGASFPGAQWQWGPSRLSREPNGYYAELTEAFLAGQLHLKAKPDPRLAKLANPYAGDQGVPKPTDVSYFNNRFYLYFGTPPVFLLFAPFHLLTGFYLQDGIGATFFGLVGFGVGAWLLLRLRTRLFPQLGESWVVVGLAVWCLASQAQLLAYTNIVFTVPINCAFACLTAAVACCTLAWENPGRRRWLVLGGLMWGLAIASRPNYLFSLVGLLVFLAGVLLRNQAIPVNQRRGMIGLLTAAVLPVLLIGLALMFYNWVRYHLIAEFGTAYQLISWDQRHLQSLAWGRLGQGLHTTLLQQVDYSTYFPFAAPLGKGALCTTPILLLVLLLPALWFFAPPAERPFWRVGGTALLVATIANLLTVGMLLTQEYRYNVDYLSAGVLLVVLISWSVAQSLAFRPGWKARAGAIALGLTMGITLLHGVANNVNFLNLPQHTPALSRWLNVPTHWIETAVGYRYGPLLLRGRLPPRPVGTVLPLVVTGRGNDVLYARYVGPDQVQFGFFHVGEGGPKALPLTLDLMQEHIFEIDLGSLYPPPEHPLFAGRSAREIKLLKQRVRVTVDGVIILDGASDFYPTHPGELHIGKNPRGLLTDLAQFDLADFKLERMGLPKQSGPVVYSLKPVRLEITFPPFVHRKREPLISTGRSEAGDLFYVTYVGHNLLRFAHDSWGGSNLESWDVPYVPGRVYSLEVDMGSLHPRPAGTRFEGPLRVQLDGEAIMATTRPFNASEATELAFGYNACRSSATYPSFTGQIRKITPIDTLTDKPQQYGAVRMAVQFPVVSNPRAEPLVVSGRPGAGDFIYVAYAGDGTLRLGYDHWGIGGPLSESIPVNQQDQETHLLEISMGSLLPAVENNAAWGKVSPETRRQLKATIIIKMDGRTMLQHHSLAYPAGQSEVNVGSNPVGGSTCETIFTGRVLLSERIPPHLSVPTGPP